MIFDILPQDLVLLILTKCDVVTALKFGQTCRYLREISLSRHLWLSLVQNLDYDHAPNILPHESIKSLSSERLCETAIRAARSYLNWTSAHGPKATRSVTLPTPQHDDLRRSAPTLHMLVPGGRYYVFHRGNGYFYCHDTEHHEIFYTYRIPSYTGEFLQNLDCLLIDDGSVLIMAFIICRKSNEIFASVVRFDLVSGIAREMYNFSLPQVEPDEFERFQQSSESRLKIHNDVVVVWTPGSFLVGDWRLGDIVVVKENDTVHSIDIAQGHILCAISRPPQTVEYAAAPLSLIFSKVEAGRGRRNSDSYALVRSEEVFIYVAQIACPEAFEMTTPPSVQLVSVCTGSWKHVDQWVQTRILIFLRVVLLTRQYYMISQLDFCSTSTLHFNGPSSSVAVVNDYETSKSTVQEYHHFTGQRHSPLFPYVADFPERIRFTTAARTGRAVGSFLDYNNLLQRKRTYYGSHEAITPTLRHGILNLHDHIGETDHVPVGHFYSRAKYSEISGMLCGKGMDVRLGMDEYSGAVWYRRGSSVFIHYFD